MSWRQTYWLYVVAGLGCAAVAPVAEKYAWYGEFVSTMMLIGAGVFIAHSWWAGCCLKAERLEAANSRQMAALITHCSEHPEIGEEDKCAHDD